MYSLESTWVFESPLEPLWSALIEVGQWGCWWPGLERCELLEPADPWGVGARYRQVWRLAPSQLVRLEVRVSEVIAPHLLELNTTRGFSRWVLTEEGGFTLVHHTWIAQEPAACKALLCAGAKGLARHLGLCLKERGSWLRPLSETDGLPPWH
jgi:hypothetical protein